MKLRKWKLLSAAVACIAFAVGGAVCAGAETSNDEPEIAFSDEREAEIESYDSSSDLTFGDYKYTVNDDGTVTITDYTGSATELVIPDNIEGKRVTSIGSCAFEWCEELESVTIPDSVTSIGDHAFYGCTSLESITIPDSVTFIESFAFIGCTSLTSVTIPDSVAAIGESTFEDCTSLTSITIPDSVTSIGGWAFRNCTSLTSITIPNGVTSIKDYAFSKCTSLTSVTVPNSVTSIANDAFLDCTSLTNINVDENNAKYKSVDGILFNKDMSELSAFPGGKGGKYIIPDGVTTIGVCAFSGCSNLTGITIPDGVTDIGRDAFEDCTSLTSITIPNSVTSIGIYAFYDCASLSSITIPDSVTTIGNIAFDGCDNLTIYGYTGSYAETYAKENNIPFVSLDAPKFTSKPTAISGNRSITLSWKAVENATGYIVKSADGKTQYTKNAITATSYTVTGLKNGTQYKFKVYANIGGKWYDSSVVTKTPVAKPENVKAVANNKKVTLSWDKVPNATSYIVKSADGETQYTKSSIKTTSYTVTGLKNSTQYKFKVYAYSDGKWFASSTISKTPTGKPQNLKAVAGSKKITLSWDKVDGATGYIVKSADGSTQYTKNTIKTNSYTVTGLTGSKQYKFKVYAKVDGKWYASSTITRTAKK